MFQTKTKKIVEAGSDHLNTISCKNCIDNITKTLLRVGNGYSIRLFPTFKTVSYLQSHMVVGKYIEQHQRVATLNFKLVKT